MLCAGSTQEMRRALQPPCTLTDESASSRTPWSALSLSRRRSSFVPLFSLRPLDLRNRRLGLVLRDAFQSGRVDALHKVTVCRAAADCIVREIQGRPRQRVEAHWRAGPCDPINVIAGHGIRRADGGLPTKIDRLARIRGSRQVAVIGAKTSFTDRAHSQLRTGRRCRFQSR
jgi:hypothetical protein